MCYHHAHRSNLENHPARIIEPQKVSGRKGGGLIKLSNKSGMPAAYSSIPAGTGTRAGGDVLAATAAVTSVSSPFPTATAKAAAGGEEAAAGGKDGAAAEAGEARGDDGSEASDSDNFDGEVGSVGTTLVGAARRKGETAEEKRARKSAVKGERRESRATKKMVKSLFKEEGARQKKQASGKSAAAPGLSTFVIP